MKALGTKVKDSIITLRSEVNELATTMKVIIMTMGKTPVVGRALECKGK